MACAHDVCVCAAVHTVQIEPLVQELVLSRPSPRCRTAAGVAGLVTTGNSAHGASVGRQQAASTQVWVCAEHEVEMAGTSGTSPADPPFRVTFLPASAPEANGTAKPGKRKRQADGAAPQASFYCSGRQTCMKAASMLLCILAGASAPRSCSTHSCCQGTGLGQTRSSEASMSCRPRPSTAAALF